MMNAPLPQQVVSTLAKREYRLWHWLWEEVRQYWLTYPKDVQQKLRDSGWEPPRPTWDENGLPITDKDAGEDFLYMHRQLLTRVNTILAGVGDPNFPRVEGWVTLPPPDDPVYPVPPYFYIPEAPAVTNEFNRRAKLPFNFERRFKHWEVLCTSPSFLKRVTLGQLGSIIEETLYLGARARWASAPGAWRSKPDPANPDTTPPGFDDPKYDFLRDPYAMHLNPIYWRFFGWVDDRVEDWKAANGVFGNDFWRGTWVGNMPAA